MAIDWKTIISEFDGKPTLLQAIGKLRKAVEDETITIQQAQAEIKKLESQQKADEALITTAQTTANNAQSAAQAADTKAQNAQSAAQAADTKAQAADTKAQQALTLANLYLHKITVILDNDYRFLLNIITNNETPLTKYTFSSYIGADKPTAVLVPEDDTLQVISAYYYPNGSVYVCFYTNNQITRQEFLDSSISIEDTPEPYIK